MSPAQHQKSPHSATEQSVRPVTLRDFELQPSYLYLSFNSSLCAQVRDQIVTILSNGPLNHPDFMGAYVKQYGRTVPKDSKFSTFADFMRSIPQVEIFSNSGNRCYRLRDVSRRSRCFV